MQSKSYIARGWSSAPSAPPPTHSAHHGKHKEDGITYYKGNFGNMLFLWDTVFGTAKITRKVPEEFGVENLNPSQAGQQLLWPLLWPPFLW